MNAQPETGPPTPGHVGVIMDGNGRWARRRGLPRAEGHRAGARAARRATEAAVRLGLRQLTLFAFSSENWRRPAREVKAIMGLFTRYLRGERRRLVKNGVRLRAIGRLAELPPEVRRELDATLRATESGESLTLCLAVNYGGRHEIVDACRRLAQSAVEGRIAVKHIEEADIEARLYQSDMPPLDLVARTGGEMRLSNFLLWQAAYAEIVVMDTLWPDFDEAAFRAAVETYAKRDRRFGGLPFARREGALCES